MACNKCYNNSCNGSCNKSSISRQIRLQNNSIGRDGESAYETYVRTTTDDPILTEQEWSDRNINHTYAEFNI